MENSTISTQFDKERLRILNLADGIHNILNIQKSLNITYLALRTHLIIFEKLSNYIQLLDKIRKGRKIKSVNFLPNFSAIIPPIIAPKTVPIGYNPAIIPV